MRLGKCKEILHVLYARKNHLHSVLGYWPPSNAALRMSRTGDSFVRLK